MEALAQVTDSRRNRVVFSQSYFKEDTQKDDGYGSLVQSLKDNFIALTQELLVDFQAKQK